MVRHNEPGKTGKLPPIGNTVNVKDATYTNAIGAPSCTHIRKTRASIKSNVRLLLA